MPILPTAMKQRMTFAYQVENWYNDGLYDWVCWGDEWFAQVDDGSYVAYHDLKPWLELDEIAYHDPNLGKELSDIYAGFESKVRSFKEARSAVKQKGKSRGYFSKGPPKGKGKFGKGFSQKGSTIFPIPGIARDPPQVPQMDLKSQDNQGIRDVSFVGISNMISGPAQNVILRGKVLEKVGNPFIW